MNTNEDGYEVAKKKLQDFKKKIGIDCIDDKEDNNACVYDCSLKVRA